MIYFFDSYGRITRCLQAPANEAIYVVKEGEQWIEHSEIVSDSDYYIKNNSLTEFPQKPGDGWVWDWELLMWRLPESFMSEARDVKCKEIDALRDYYRFSGVVYNNVLFDSDPVATGNLTGWTAAIAAGIPIPEGFTWRSMDNRDIPFTSEDVLGLAAASVAKTTACYKRAWQLKSLVEAFTDPADYQQLRDFDITTQWPENPYS